MVVMPSLMMAFCAERVWSRLQGISYRCLA